MDRLDSVLSSSDFIDLETLEHAQSLAHLRKDHILRVLFDIGAISSEMRAAIAAEALDIPRFLPGDLPAHPVQGDALDRGFLQKIEAVPLGPGDQDGAMRVAMVDPFNNEAQDILRVVLRQDIQPVAIDIEEFERAIDRVYGIHETDLTIPKRLLSYNVDPEMGLEDAAQQVPVVRTVKSLLDKAVRMRASDIHIEPYAGQLRVRYRIDGLLTDQSPPEAAMTAALISRLKILARLNIAERRKPQDGRFSYPCDGREIDIRMSSVPTVEGESVVLRLLDKQAAVFDFSKLGMPENIHEDLDKLLTNLTGMLLITGPTGSGKTTTLYAALQKLNKSERKIISIEDPVEYQINGINQMAVQPSIGLDFATLLRSVLRHDPDIVMVGELRDAETAEIAVRAALTGHLVLSTLHTNSASGAVTRLADLGIPRFLIASVFRASFAQRLLRRICLICADQRPLTPQEAENLATLSGSSDLPSHVPVPVGCESCAHTGYNGRIGVYEFFRPTPDMIAEISTGADETHLAALARQAGQASLAKDGINKLFNGITTPEELERTLGAVWFHG